MGVSLGKHVIADIEGVPFDILNNSGVLNSFVIQSIQDGTATLIKYIDHNFTPQGCTGLFLLAESHVSYHTYPEYGRIMVDAFTCGDKASPLRIIQGIIKQLDSASKKKVGVILTYHDRGLMQ